MYKVLLFLCEQNLSVLALFSSINNLYILFKQMLTDLDSLVQQKLLITTGLSVDKKNMKSQLAEMAERVAGAIHAYADDTGNNELMHQVNFSSKKLARMRDVAMGETCRIIYTLATANAANISGYGIDANMLQTFDTSISLYENKSPQPTEAREHGATLTKAIADKEKEIRIFLKNRFDKAIHILAPGNPAFVSDYFNSRKVIDAGLRHQIVIEDPEEMAYMRGSIADTEGNPLEDAKITIANDTLSYVDETDEDGDYLHEAIASGKYTVTISMDGYKSITEEIEFAANDEILRDYEMEADSIVNSGADKP